MPKRVLGILGGLDYPPDLLKKWAETADILIAADSGADTLLALGCTPNAIVGDFDSCSEAARDSGAELYKFSDQNYTDCDKLLRFASERDLYPLVLAGVEGDRLDHVLATLHSVASSGHESQITLALRQGVGWVLGPGNHEMDVPACRRVSLIPLERSFGVRTVGARWELEGDDLGIGARAAISNETMRHGFHLSFERGMLFVVAEFTEAEIPRW